MEPESGIIGAILGAIAGLTEPSGGGSYDPRTDVPADYRPLQLATEGYVYDMRPAELVEVAMIMDNGPSLYIAFGETAATWIADRTTQAIGERMWVYVCGVEVAVPVIQTPILDGQVMITGDFTVEELDQIASYITGADVCTDFEEPFLK